MTIRQLEAPCWSVPGLDDERNPHFENEAAAVKAARAEGCAAAYVHRCAARCWVIECDGQGGLFLDEEDEGWIYHCKSRAEAEETMRACKWVQAGDLVYCAGDAPEDATLPPPGAAELEAAGQLLLRDGS